MIDVIFLVLTIASVFVATLAALATTSASPTIRVTANKAGQLQRGHVRGNSNADRLVLLLAAGLELPARSATRPNITRVRSACFGRCLSISPANWPSSRLHSHSILSIPLSGHAAPVPLARSCIGERKTAERRRQVLLGQLTLGKLKTWPG